MMPRALTVLCLLPLLAFAQWEMDFDEDFAAAAEKPDVLDGLVAWWKFDELSYDGSTGEVKDSSGTGNDGTSYNGLQTAVGKIGRAGNFDGNDDFVDFGISASLNSSLNSNFSITYWVYGNVSGQNQTIFGNKGAKYSRTIGYNWWLDGRTAIVDENVTVIVSAPTTVGTWQFFSFVYDGYTMTIYVDGSKEASASYSFSSSYNSNYKIGDSHSSYSGLIDDFRIYNRALSSNEVSTIYNLYK